MPVCLGRARPPWKRGACKHNTTIQLALIRAPLQVYYFDHPSSLPSTSGLTLEVLTFFHANGVDLARVLPFSCSPFLTMDDSLMDSVFDDAGGSSDFAPAPKAVVRVSLLSGFSRGIAEILVEGQSCPKEGRSAQSESRAKKAHTVNTEDNQGCA